MGLFSSEKKTYVGTSVSRVLTDDNIPNSVQLGMINSIFTNESPADHILEELVTGIGMRAERAYSYGGNGYIYGLPGGERVSSGHYAEEVEAVLEAIEGTQVLVDYSFLGAPNSLHTMWGAIIADLGYDLATNQLGVLTTQQGKPVYLETMNVVCSTAYFESLEPASLRVWGPPPNTGYTPIRSLSLSNNSAGYVSHIINNSVITPYIQVTSLTKELAWDPDRFPSQYSVFPLVTHTLSMPEMDEDADYFQVRYVVGGVVKYWTYRLGEGTYPSLDSLSSTEPGLVGEYFPFLYLRYGKTAMNADTDSVEYKSSKKLANRLGLDYDQIVDAAHENPDIDDVEQAMLVFAVPPNPSSQEELRYLFDYYTEQSRLHNNSNMTIMERAISSKLAGGYPSLNATVIQDARFKMTLANDGIYRRLRPGRIGAKGVYTGEYKKTLFQHPVTDSETGHVSYISGYVSAYIYRYQIDDSIYEEIEVVAPKMTYHIYGRYTSIGDETDPILLIPVDHTIARTYSLPVREVLYSKAMHYIFNSRVVVKVKWYQQGWFSAVLLVVAVILAIPSMGTSMAVMATAYGVGVAALLATILVLVAKIVISKIVIKLFVKLVGEQAAFLVAIAMILAAIVGVVDAGGLPGAPWAETLLQTSANLISGVSSVTEDNFNNLLEDQSEFSKYVEEQLKTLESAKQLLNGNNLLSPFVIMGESPNDFYNRTVHSGNIGTIGISAIGSFVDVALTLPDFSQSVGELA
ncbi:MAG: hypothetical protein KC496_00190 [Anaerolineae bacterium]|nr:hypothetical protein [Anaerolineae bacterium]